MNIKQLVLSTSATLLCAASVSAKVITFDDNALSPDSFFNPQANTSFTSAGVNFDHSWNDTFNCCWGNFTYSNRTDTTTPGFLNDRSAITGSGANGSNNYGVSFGNGAYINFGKNVHVNRADISNTTYTYLSMLNGDFFANAFGADDYLRLTISGLDKDGVETGSEEVSLGEGTDLLDVWSTVDLSSLGKLRTLTFNYSGTDQGPFGLNTPTYFVIDDIEYEAVSEPAIGLLLLSGALSMLGLRRRQIKK